MRSLARRERRPLWGILTFLLSVGVGLSIWAAASARQEGIREASTASELAAQTELAPMLQVRDLTTPITGDRARELTRGIERAITSASAVQDVRIFSSGGRILYAADPKFVGTRPSYLRDLTFEVAGGRSQTVVRQGLLQTYVPIWMNPGGDVAVAELSQPVSPVVAEATAEWFRIAMIAGALLLGCAAMVAVTTRAAAPRPAPVQLYAPAASLRMPHEPAGATAPLYQHTGFRALEEQRQAAEHRAHAVEENFRAVQQRLKEALGQVKDLEGRLAMNETQSTTSDGELQALRDQLRETAERLHTAELDNNALRERMALRHQELEEARRMLVEVRAESDAEEIAARLSAADRRAGEMEREIDQLEEELRYTNTKFHMTRFSQALRELDEDDLEIEEEDDLFEHPVIIRNTPTTPQKVR